MSEAAVMTRKPLASLAVEGRKRSVLWIGIGIAVLLIGIVFTFAYRNIEGTRSRMQEDILQRQKSIVDARVEKANVWLDSLVEQSRRLVGSDLFQLFASEVDKLPGGVPLLFAPKMGNGEASEENGVSQARQLSSQLPLMRTMLSEFIAYTGFSAARIVNSSAESYMATEASAPPLSSAQRSYVEKVIESNAPFYAPLELQTKGMVLDVYLPIFPPRYQQQTSRPVAVIILSQLVDGRLADLLAPSVSADTGRSFKLVQRNGNIFQNISPGMAQLRHIPDFSVDTDNSLSFALRKSFSGTKDVYSSGMRVLATDWWVVAEDDAAILQEELADKQRTVYILAGLISCALVLLFSALWWWLLGQEQCRINAQVTDLLDLVRRQKELLDGINSTIRDPISLTDSKGVYEYVNQAFASAVGRQVEDVIGLDSSAVFGFDTAKRLNVSDQHVLMNGESVSISEVLWLQSKRYFFQISKTPLMKDGERGVKGIVSVFRDLTELAETQERGRRVVQQTIDALVRTIEAADPFLGGHSRIMGGIATLMAKQLRLSDLELSTVETAANLSQIGKMYVPRDILLKPGTLTQEEKQEMERHVEHSRALLKNIEFDLPVLDAISDMHERLDGQGYPNGLAGEQISMVARVLAVANAFTAMARPRSYRAALPVAEVLAVLEKQQGSYDQEVVAALRQVIETPAGERLVKQAAESKAE